MSAPSTITTLSGVQLDGTCKLTADQIKTSTNNTLTFPAAGGTLATTDDVANAGGSVDLSDYALKSQVPACVRYYKTSNMLMSAVCNKFSEGYYDYMVFKIGKLRVAQVTMKNFKVNSTDTTFNFYSGGDVYNYVNRPIDTYAPIFTESGDVAGYVYSWYGSSIKHVINFKAAPNISTKYYCTMTFLGYDD